MDVRVVDERPRPGVQHGQNAEAAADVVRVRGERPEALGGGRHEGGEADALVRADDLAEGGGEREDDMEVGDGEQLGLTGGEPGGGGRAVALGAAPVAAGVVDVVLVAAGVTAVDLPA